MIPQKTITHIFFNQRQRLFFSIFLMFCFGIGGGFEAQAASADFQVNLKSSLILDAGTGNPTFTRASTATVTDFEGLIKIAKINEARFEGARRVENLMPTSSVLLTSGNNKTITVTAGTYVFSMGAGASSGVATFSGTGGATGAITQDATKRTSKSFTLAAGSFIVTASVATLVDLQFEQTTGQTISTIPSEYVSVGVLSAPYQGTGADGVQYFTTQNGNTVAGDGVTEAIGAAIPDATLYGYVAEGSRTNLVLNSGTLVTQNVTVTAQAYTLSFYGTGSVALSGTYTGNLSGTGANNRVSLTFTPTAGTLTLTVTGMATSAQLEAGAFASSYIPTVASTVTRASGSLSYPVAGNILTTTGTMYAEPIFEGINYTARGYLILLNDGGNNRLVLRSLEYSGGASINIVTGVYGTGSANIGLGTDVVTAGTKYKYALNWGASGGAIFQNGVKKNSNATASSVSFGSTISIGSNAGNNSHYGTIRNVKIWKSLLSDSDITNLDTISPPTTTISPPQGTYAATQSVFLTCDDGVGSGCDKTYYTIDGTSPTTSSIQYSGAISIAATTTLKFFSTDLNTNTETFQTKTYTIDPTALTRGTIQINSNLQSWLDMAAGDANPILERNAQVFSGTQSAYVPPTNLSDAGVYRGAGESMVPFAFAAADPTSSLRGRADLLQNAVDRVDWLASKFQSDGTLPLATDPNINRFALGPLLDSILYLQELPALQWGSVTWPNKAYTLSQVSIAIQHQRDVSDGLFPGTDLYLGPNYSYPNQDVYILLILAQANLLNLSATGDEGRITTILQKTNNSLYADGGIAYIGQDTESPVYHQLDVIILARYYTLTQDARALSILQDTVNYWPLSLTEVGASMLQAPSPWMKQYWGDQATSYPTSLIIVAGLTGDMRNVQLLAQILSNHPISSYYDISYLASIYALPYWTPQLTSNIQQVVANTVLSQHFLVSDANTRGVDGREGTWYYELFQGRGLRNTFVGGAISQDTPATGAEMPLAAFRGARIKVVLSTDTTHPLWVSEKSDNTCLALTPDTSAVLGARYTLQTNKWPNVSSVTTSPTPWQVTQVWRGTPQGMIGSVVLETTQAVANVQSIIGQIPLGPTGIVAQGGNVWSSGPLSVKVFEHFSTVAIVASMSHTDNDLNSKPGMLWPGLEINLPVNGTVASGQRFTYSVWVGPSTQTPPDTLATIFAPTNGFNAQWGTNPVVSATFNPTTHQCSSDTTPPTIA
ncbi:MAG: chitobiase/beta-hexosaminidase C-terminal domain-containing protein, partial [Candidatus Moraniibacteriota bacterium]